MLLSLYRACSVALAPLAPSLLFLRAKMRRARLGQEDRLRRGERLGRPSAVRPHGRLAWVHGATSADVASLAPLIDRLAAAGFNVLATTRDDGSDPPRLPPTALHQLAPLDARRFIASFLAFWRPDVALLAGFEFWPNAIGEMRRRGVPIALIDAHMPDLAFFFLSRLPRFARSLFHGIDACLTRTAEDARRFQSLGLLYAQAVGNPVYDFAPAPADGPALARLSARIGARPAWVAFPDEAEEDIVIEAHRKIAANFPDLLTIVVPGRVKRGPDIVLRAGKLGLNARIAAEDGDEAALPALQIAAVSGAGLFYRAAGIVFLGRSIVPSSRGGGINPIEPAKLGCAILHGPHVAHFDAVYAALDDAGGAVVVEDAATLASEVSMLLFESPELRATGRAAAVAVDSLSGASSRIMQAISPYLAQAFIRPGIEDEADDEDL